MKNAKFLCISFLILISVSCHNKDEYSPKGSFRNKQKWIAGKWKILRVDYYDGVIAGMNRRGDSTDYYIEVKDDGHTNDLKPNGDFIRNRGYWSWLSGNQSYQDYEAFTMDRNGIPIVELHVILNYKKDFIKTKYFYYIGDTNRYFIYEWTRI